jgi:hypothetical protein
MSTVMLLAAALLAPHPATQARAPYVDYAMGAQTEAEYRFRCGARIASLAFREERRSEREVPRLADRWRIAFEALSLASRPVSTRDEARLREVFHRFSWFTHIRALCPGDGGVEIVLQGMSAEAWADFNEGRLKERPRETSFRLVLGTDGSLTIS